MLFKTDPLIELEVNGTLHRTLDTIFDVLFTLKPDVCTSAIAILVLAIAIFLILRYRKCIHKTPKFRFHSNAITISDSLRFLNTEIERFKFFFEFTGSVRRAKVRPTL